MHAMFYVGKPERNSTMDGNKSKKKLRGLSPQANYTDKSEDNIKNGFKEIE